MILTLVLLCFVTIQAYSDRANKQCYTDESYVGYKKLYDSSSDLYSNRWALPLITYGIYTKGLF